MTLLEGSDTCQYVRMLLQLELAYMHVAMDLLIGLDGVLSYM